MNINPEFIATVRINDVFIHYKDGDRLYAGTKHGFYTAKDYSNASKRSIAPLFESESALWASIKEKMPSRLTAEADNFYSQLKLIRANALIDKPEWLAELDEQFSVKCKNLYDIVVAELGAVDSTKAKVSRTYETTRAFSRSLIRRKLKIPGFNELVVLRLYVQACPFNVGTYQVEIRLQPVDKESSYEHVFNLATKAQNAQKAMKKAGFKLEPVLAGTNFE